MIAKRRISQLVFLVLLHSSWGLEAKWLCNPVLTCHSCVLAWFACPIGVFVHYSGYHLFPFLAVGTVLLIGVLVGRLLCGWVCPFGFLMDLLYKIPSRRKFLLPNWTGYIKYVVLLVMVFLLPSFLGEETLYSFCRICPASAIEVTIPNILTKGTSTIEALTIVKLALLAGVIVLAVFSSRSFCKVFCPIGALLAPLNFVSFWALRPPGQTCQQCSSCDKHCPSNGLPSSRIAAGIPANRALECIVCHDCQQTCPHQERGSGVGYRGATQRAPDPKPEHEECPPSSPVQSPRPLGPQTSSSDAGQLDAFPHEEAQQMQRRIVCLRSRSL